MSPSKAWLWKLQMEQPIKYSEHLQEVRNLLKHVQDEPLKSMDMVNALQKLCINHHFKEEIDSILKTHYTKIFNGHVSNHDQSLYEVSINFRILRQQGYYIPADDVFAGFKQKNGIFLEEMTEDVKGLMTLYEASQLSIEGEHILEEAADFSSHALKEMIPFLDQDEAIMVKNTLEHSYQKTSSTFMVKKFIKHYSGTTMSQLAEMELAKLQALHRTEVTQIFSTLWAGAIFSLVALIRKSLPPQPIESIRLEIVTDDKTSTIQVKGDEERGKGCVVVVVDESIKKEWDVFGWKLPNPSTRREKKFRIHMLVCLRLLV
uniref:Terpene synthase N-terminal domain-containing protein n=1 Tax=Lactuca sativa TaxID=4236 RepID=A0A9R1VKY0_LACSA|nr:hypothetical protein LSAT_V11C400179620 [Lactuca sativa]